jgi:hypothetical protein
MIPHLLRCRGFAVDDYSFTLGRLGFGASSTFAQLGLYLLPSRKNANAWHLGLTQK